MIESTHFSLLLTSKLFYHHSLARMFFVDYELHQKMNHPGFPGDTII